MFFHKKIFLILTGFLFLLFSPLSLSAEPSELQSWFKHAVLIKTYQQSYDWRIPWEKRDISTQTGMALVVALPSKHKSNSLNKDQTRLYLLTTAELVADATLIEATRKGEREPIQATVRHMDYAANLALLEISDQNFFSKLASVKWAPAVTFKKEEDNEIQLLKLKSRDEWELVTGNLKQMAVGHRDVSQTWFPVMQLSGDAQVNQGYPVIQNDKTIAMVLEVSGDEIKAIPSQMIIEFLSHSTLKAYKSLAHRGFLWQRLPQKSVMEYLQIPENTPGIWISKVLPYGTGSRVLKPGDYLTKIGEWELSVDGQVQHPKWGKSLFDLLFLDDLKVGNSLNLSVIRNGLPIILKTQISSYEENGRTVPLRRVGHPPRYIIQGGFLFQELTVNYLRMWGPNWHTIAPLRLRLFLEQNKTVMIHKKNEAENTSNAKIYSESRVVLVTQVLPDPINIGYQKLSNAIVLKINGISIKKLADVTAAFANIFNEKYHRINFLPGSDRINVILPAKQIKEANQRIMNNFRIPKLQSL